MVLWRLEVGANLSNFELAGFVVSTAVLMYEQREKYQLPG